MCLEVKSFSLIFLSDHLCILQDADQQAELSKREKEEILAKLSQTERMLAEGKARVNKLEEDNSKLRRALEHSMTRLNRMSMDSDYLVDRLACLDVESYSYYEELSTF